jgi:hypothetical protein
MSRKSNVVMQTGKVDNQDKRVKAFVREQGCPTAHGKDFGV